MVLFMLNKYNFWKIMIVKKYDHWKHDPLENMTVKNMIILKNK